MGYGGWQETVGSLTHSPGLRGHLFYLGLAGTGAS